MIHREMGVRPRNGQGGDAIVRRPHITVDFRIRQDVPLGEWEEGLGFFVNECKRGTISSSLCRSYRRPIVQGYTFLDGTWPCLPQVHQSGRCVPRLLLALCSSTAKQSTLLKNNCTNQPPPFPISQSFQRFSSS